MRLQIAHYKKDEDQKIEAFKTLIAANDLTHGEKVEAEKFVDAYLTAAEDLKVYEARQNKLEWERLQKNRVKRARRKREQGQEVLDRISGLLGEHEHR